MIIFLYGPDSYRLKQNSQIVLDNYRKKHPSGIFFKFDLSDVNETAKVEDAVKSGSLFGEVRLIVLKNAFFSEDGSGRVGELIKTQNILKEKDIVLVFIENQEGKELAKNKILFSLLTRKDPAQSNLVRNIEYLEGEKLTKWVKSEFVSRKCSIEQDAIKELVTTTGNESWALVNEIDKLCNFKISGIIKKEDVILLGFKKMDLNIFDFVDAIAEKNKTKAYEILFKEIKNSRDPYYLLSMIVYGFRNILLIKNLVERKMDPSLIAKKSDLHPFVVRKTSVSVSKFTLDELRVFYKKLLDIDTLSKNGTVNIIDALYDFIIC